MAHAAEDAASGLSDALDGWGIRARRLARAGAAPGELWNQAWHVWTPDGRHLMAKRHEALRTRAEVAYEIEVTRHLGGLGWAVPVPAAELAEVGGRLYSLRAYVAGGPCDDRPATSLARGALLARLHAALLPLRECLGQRPCWRAQPDLDDPRLEPDRGRGLDLLRAADPALAAAAERAIAASRAELTGLGLDTLPRFLLHGDFTTSNVRQRRGRPCGVIDFDLCHLGTRPWELVIARLQRAPAMLHGYRNEAARLGIPLSAEEEAVLPGVYRALRAGMVGWALANGARQGTVDAAFLGVQLEKLRLGLT